MEPTAQSNLRDGGSGSCGSAKQARRELLRRRVSPTPRLAGRAVAPPRPVEDPEQQDRAEDETGFRERVAELAFGDDADELGGLMLDNSFARNSDASACGKVTVLLRLLALWASEDLSNKVLLFSHSTRMLDLVQAMLLAAGYSFLRLDGSTKRTDRQKLVDTFNTSPSVYILMLSTTAGGVGINLTAANKVVIIDPSWNPAHDLQAQDRAFRIGQKRDVMVFRLIATGTLDELIYMRQIYKQQQANVAVEGADESRYFIGVQGARGQEGELWGVVNMFKDHLDFVETHQVIGDTRQAENMRIETVNLSNLAGGAVGAEDAAPRREDDDDAGLGALAREAGVADVKPEAARAARSGRAGSAAGAGPALGDEDDLDEEDEGSEAAEGALNEMEQLAESGIAHVHVHGAVLGASAHEAAIAARARALAATHMDGDCPPPGLAPPARSTAEVGAAEAARLGMRLPPSFGSGRSASGQGGIGPGGKEKGSDGKAAAADGSKVLNHLESLAAWRDVDVKEMAARLLEMSDAQLSAERKAYADAKGGGGCCA